MKPLEDEHGIDIWDDSWIKPGSKWREEIEKALRSAKVALLLVSASFLASDFIRNDELPKLLLAAKNNGATIMPVIISPCRFEQTESLCQFQAINPPSKPLSALKTNDQEKIFVKIANLIAERAREIKELRTGIEHLEKSRETIKAPAKPLDRARYKVRLFLLAESLDEDRFNHLLVQQNIIQPLFQFELGHVRNYQPKVVEQKFCSIPSDFKRGTFIEQCEETLADAEITYGKQPQEQSIRIAVTQAALPGAHYLWGHFEGTAKWHDPPKEHWGRFEPNKFWVVSLASVKRFLEEISAEQFVLRTMQRACVNAVLPVRRKGLPDRLSHFTTNGCLFDYTVLLRQARYFAKGAFICDDCTNDILKAEEIPPPDRSDFLKALQKWLVDTQKMNVPSGNK